MLTQEDLQTLEALFDKKLAPIKQDIAGMKEDLAEIKENAEITREATNYLLDLVEGKEKAIRKLM